MKYHTFVWFIGRNILSLHQKYDKSYCMNIGVVIKERRALLGISQQDLAEFSGVGISTVKDLERGVGNPSLQTLQKILDVVGMEIIVQRKQTV